MSCTFFNDSTKADGKKGGVGLGVCPNRYDVPYQRPEDGPFSSLEEGREDLEACTRRVSSSQATGRDIATHVVSDSRVVLERRSDVSSEWRP